MTSNPVRMVPTMDSVDGLGSGKHNVITSSATDGVQQEHFVLGCLPKSKSGLGRGQRSFGRSSSPSPSSSTRSSSLDDDFFQLEGSEFKEPTQGEGRVVFNINGHESSSTQVGDAADLLASALGLRVTKASETSTSNTADGASSTDRSPPAQVMVRSEAVPDPYRIPLSVFEASKPTTPAEWSIASNESCFSIHVGSISLCKDQANNLDGGRSDEVACTTGTHDPHQSGVDVEAADVDAAKAETMKAFLDRAAAAADERAACEHRPPVEHGGGTLLSASTSRRSDCSATSANSFAFPILAGAHARTGSAKIEPVVDHLDQAQQEEGRDEITETREEMRKPVSAPEGGRGRSWCPCFPCTYRW